MGSKRLSFLLPRSMLLERISYLGESDETHTWILETINRLPMDVAAFVADRCCFVSVGKNTLGLTLPGRIGVHFLEKRTRNCWIIVLEDDVSPEHAHSLVAHEIAHAWRGDDRCGIHPEDCEIETAKLVKRWGFKGLGADVEFQVRQESQLKAVNEKRKRHSV